MSWLMKAPFKSKKMRHRIFTRTVKSFFALLLILSLASCGDKAVSKEPSIFGSDKNNPQLTNQISEVSPPSVIQELRRSLDAYRPQVTIITPKFDEVLEKDTVEVKLTVKDLPLFKSQFDLGSHLQVILDDQPGTEVFDLNQPLTLSSLSPGTHTLRVFAERPWYESFKNEGAYAQTTFHVFTKTDEHNPDTSLPLLTYNRPNGDYGAEPILLDFYLTNAPLQINGKDILKDEIGDWRIRCTINGESFVLDRWESVYLKGFKPGKNWIKLEFLDGKGEVVKNVFNSTVRSITYEPKGKDTLSRIVRGEFSADEVRSIVDSGYVAPEQEPEPTPTIEPSIEPTPQAQKEPELVEPTPEETLQPKPEVIPSAKPKSDGFFKRRDIKAPIPAPSIEPNSETPDLPEVIITPSPLPSVVPTPEVTIPEKKAPDVEKPIIKSPTPEVAIPEKKAPDVEKPVIEPPTPQTETPKKIPVETIKPSKVKLGKYFQRRESPTPEVTIPETKASEVEKPVIESPTPEVTIPEKKAPDVEKPVIEPPTPQTKTPKKIPVETIKPLIPEIIPDQEVTNNRASEAPLTDVTPTGGI
jgi:predicted small lipoprotein YifL